MTKKIFVIAFLTGLGQLLSAALYPLASRYVSPAELTKIGLFDTNIMLVTGWLAFGLNAVATREIALTNNWKPVLEKVQTARISFSLVLCILGVVGLNLFQTHHYFWLVLIFSPILSINFDFALYALGKPVSASIMSFLRVAVPLLIFSILLIQGLANSSVYISLVLIFALASAMYTARSIGFPLFKLPEINFYKMYFYAANIGIAGLFIGFQRYGFMNFLDPVWDKDKMVSLLIVMKVFLFVVACKRMLVQIFYTKLMSVKISSNINFFCFFVGVFTVVIVFVFPMNLSVFLFNDESKVVVTKVMSLGVFSILLFPTADAIILLNKLDKPFAIVTILVSCIFVTFIYLNRSDFSLNQVIISMVSSEFLLATSYFLVNIYFCKIKAKDYEL